MQHCGCLSGREIALEFARAASHPLPMIKIKIAQFGLGPIGVETLKLAATKPWVEIVGGIDIDPAKVGKSLADITGLPQLQSARVHSSVDELLAVAKPDLVFHTSVSKIKEACAQIEPLARRGISVVSSCEELLFPPLRDPDPGSATRPRLQGGRRPRAGHGRQPRFRHGRAAGLPHRRLPRSSRGACSAGRQRLHPARTAAKEDRQRIGTGGVRASSSWRAGQGTRA